jgi:hypothetical protein
MSRVRFITGAVIEFYYGISTGKFSRSRAVESRRIV